MKKLSLLLPIVTLLVLLCPGSMVSASHVEPKDIVKLIDLLANGTHFKVRVQAAKALGLLKSEDAVIPLIKCLEKDSDHLVRGTCAWALGSIAHPLADQALARVAEDEESFVVKQAARARKNIQSRFPKNLKSFKGLRYHIHLTGVTDTLSGNDDLVANVLDTLAVHYVNLPGFELGDDEMDLQDNGPKGEVEIPKELHFLVKGSIAEILTPPDRQPGKVTMAIQLGVVWQPSGLQVMGLTRFEGTADFRGGKKPASELDPDPLVDAQIKALVIAAEAAAKELDSVLGVAGPPGNPAG